MLRSAQTLDAVTAWLIDADRRQAYQGYLVSLPCLVVSLQQRRWFRYDPHVGCTTHLSCETNVFYRHVNLRNKGVTVNLPSSLWRSSVAPCLQATRLFKFTRLARPGANDSGMALLGSWAYASILVPPNTVHSLLVAPDGAHLRVPFHVLYLLNYPPLCFHLRSLTFPCHS